MDGESSWSRTFCQNSVQRNKTAGLLQESYLRLHLSFFLSFLITSRSEVQIVSDAKSRLKRSDVNLRITRIEAGEGMHDAEVKEVVRKLITVRGVV